jgi:branched-subunit amino acid ABC-type transport system permease component
LLFTDLTVQLWGPNTPVIESIFSDRTIGFFGTGVTVHQLGTAGFVAILGAGLWVVLSRTRYGSAVQAIAGDPGAARIIGLPVRAITTGTWAAGGASAALAGMMFIHLNSLDPISLTLVLIPALVAAVFGGFISLSRAVIGSLAIGVVFSLAQGYVTTSGSANLFVFAALLAVLLATRARQSALETVHAEL